MLVSFTVTPLPPEAGAILDPHLCAITDRHIAGDHRTSARRSLSEGAQTARAGGRAAVDESLKVTEQRLDDAHPGGLLGRQSRCEAVEVTVLRIVASSLRAFHGVPRRPDSRRCQAMGLGDVERVQVSMAGALLLSVLGAHSINQGLKIELVAIREEKKLPDSHACLGKFGRDVLVHETVPYVA